jgi:hypothetical protein
MRFLCSASVTVAIAVAPRAITNRSSTFKSSSTSKSTLSPVLASAELRLRFKRRRIGVASCRIRGAARAAVGATRFVGGACAGMTTLLAPFLTMIAEITLSDTPALLRAIIALAVSRYLPGC